MKKKTYIKFDSKKISLILCNNQDNLYLVYFGNKIEGDDYSILVDDCETPAVSNLMISAPGTNDFREHLAFIRYEDETYKSVFSFVGYEIIYEKPFSVLPIGRNPEKTLVLKYYDKLKEVELTQYISVYKDSDVFTSFFKIENVGTQSFRLERIMSLQLDLNGVDFNFYTYNGNWARERKLSKEKLGIGIHINDSKCGASSNLHNPFVMVENTKNNSFYAFNLVYSGNHKEIVDVTPNERTRILVGMNDYAFVKVMNPADVFYTPQALFLVTDSIQQIYENMHSFVLNEIISERYRNLPRPIVFNNWEATYFMTTNDRVRSLALKAKSLGMEMFVLDDGWFGKRSSELNSLGDWFSNYDKFPKGVEGLSKEIRDMGLKFGLWFEPEAINTDSDLFLKHPNWAMKIPGREPFLQRFELLLDLTLEDVQDYIIESICRLIESCQLDYIKWDYNRMITDCYSIKNLNGEYLYNYIISLYKIMDSIAKRYPNVLFEGCSSGGARFDLGILYYMPQIWTSDNTDARDRISIQDGTVIGYPISSISCHVSICPNHQSGNSTSIENRFNVACFGDLGYEMDLESINKQETKAIIEQIEFYKKHKELLQFGDYYRWGNDEIGSWSKVSKDKEEAIITIFIKNSITSYNNYRFSFKGLNPEYSYKVEMRKQTNLEFTYSATISGSILGTEDLFFGNLFFQETDRREYSNSITTRMFYLKKV